MVAHRGVANWAGGWQNVESGRDNVAVADVAEHEEQILRAARDLVNEAGESNFRIADLVKLSGRSVGSIYHSFGSRDGVLEAVWMLQMAESWAVDASRLQLLLSMVTTPAELDGAVELLARELHDPSRSEQLWAKLEVIAAARHRPSLRRVVERAQRAMTDTYTAALEDLQRRGVVVADVDARAVAVFVQAFTIGRIVGELGGTTTDGFEQWVEVVRRTLTGALTPQPCAG